MNKEHLIISLIEKLVGECPSTKSETQLASSFIGAYVICRSRNEGINAGYVEALDDTGVILTSVRRIWYHKPKDVNTSWYEGVALSGLSSDSKVSCSVEKKVIMEDYSLTLCSKDSEESIIGMPSIAQN